MEWLGYGSYIKLFCTRGSAVLSFVYVSFMTRALLLGIGYLNSLYSEYPEIEFTVFKGRNGNGGGN